jgi:hypothetical protein
MKHWIHQRWTICLPIACVLLFIAYLTVTVVRQSQYSEIAVADQKLLQGKVVVDRAFLKSDGFIAIHQSDANGNLVRAWSIGHIPLESGLRFNVDVRLLQPVASGTKLFAVVHRDTGSAGRYEFGQAATSKDPIELLHGEPVATAFYVD